MNEIESKADHLRKVRKKFNQTWSELAPSLTVNSFVDETVGQMMNKRGSDGLISAIAIAGAAWVFNSLKLRRNILKFSKSKTAHLKQETKDHESSNSFARRD